MICKCLSSQPYCNILAFDSGMWLFASQSVHWPVTRSWIFAFLCTVLWCLPFFGIMSQNIDIILTSGKEVPRSTHIFLTFYAIKVDWNFVTYQCCVWECVLQVSVCLALYSQDWSSFTVKTIVFEGVLVIKRRTYFVSAQGFLPKRIIRRQANSQHWRDESASLFVHAFHAGYMYFSTDQRNTSKTLYCSGKILLYKRSKCKLTRCS